MAENKNNRNFYKLTTYLLLTIIIIVFAFFAFNNYTLNKFNEGVVYGQQLTSNFVLQSLDTDGYVPLTLGNQTIALIPSQMLQVTKEQTILEIMAQVQDNGYVTLYSNSTEITLVPYNPQ